MIRVAREASLAASAICACFIYVRNPGLTTALLLAGVGIGLLAHKMFQRIGEGK